jgi:glutamyl-tRNA synthetase
MKTVRTRFAPSPTGFLHVGGVRTALFNYLWAKKNGGQFILRLEDTDRERYVAEGVDQIVESLDWLGLQPDEGFWISEGKHQNVEYVQSERHAKSFYQKYADQLLEQGLAYYSYITPEKYQEYKKENKSGPFIYGKWREAEHHDKKLDIQHPGKYPVRIDVAAIKEKFKKEQHESLHERVDWDDVIRGAFSNDLSLMEDFIIIKSDGFPTYNFANVIDDHDMQITQVIRGDEFISSTAKHVLLYELLDWQKPAFIHLPVINGSDGKKLSKRTGDTNTLEYRDKGYLPEALLNFLAQLGWNDGTEQEIYTFDELIEKFDLKTINSSPAHFDQRRLDWMNGYWIREKIELDDLYERSQSFWPAEAGDYDDEYKKQVLGLIKERLKFLAEIPELTRFFFVDLPVDSGLITNHKQLKKLSAVDLKDLLEKSKASLEISDFSVNDLSTRLNDLLEETKQKPAVLFSLIRIATTQAPASPGLADTLAILNKDRSLARIDAQLAHLS